MSWGALQFKLSMEISKRVNLFLIRSYLSHEYSTIFPRIPHIHATSIHRLLQTTCNCPMHQRFVVLMPSAKSNFLAPPTWKFNKVLFVWMSHPSKQSAHLWSNAKRTSFLCEFCISLENKSSKRRKIREMKAVIEAIYFFATNGANALLFESTWWKT